MNEREFSSLIEVANNNVKGVVLAGLILGYMILSIPIEVLRGLRILPGDRIDDGNN